MTDPVQGLTGTLTSPIRRADMLGEVRVAIRGGTESYIARSTEPIERGATVLIIEVHPGRIGQRIFGARVIGCDGLETVRGRKIVVSVAGATARQEIRDRLGAAGFAELRDFVCAA